MHTSETMYEEKRANALAKLDEPEKELLIDGVSRADILALTEPKDFIEQVEDGLTRCKLGDRHPRVTSEILLDKIRSMRRCEIFELAEWLTRKSTKSDPPVRIKDLKRIKVVGPLVRTSRSRDHSLSRRATRYGSCRALSRTHDPK